MSRFLPFLITRRIANMYAKADARDYHIIYARVLARAIERWPDAA